MQAFFAELKRRNVFKVAVAYAVVGWVLVEVSSVVLPTFESPDWVLKVVTWLIIIGFPAAVLLAWAFELTPDGLRRDEEVRDAGEPAVAEDQPAATADKADQRSIAVLPFVNMSGDEENEYFSDGLTEELLNVLAKVRGLRVAARTSCFAFKGEQSDISEIGTQLRVATVLEGSVRKAANRVRITCQLIEVENGYHLWSETYDRELDDIFAVQDSIAKSVADALHVTLMRGADVDKRHGTDNMEAYNQYLMGRHCVQRNDQPNILRAQGYFEKALELDSEFAEAWVGIAETHSWLGGWGGQLPGDHFPKARRAAEKALELNPDLVEANLELALIKLGFDWDFAGARRECREAVRRNPGAAEPHFALGRILFWLGDFEEGIAELKRSLTLDPLNLTYMHSLASAYNMSRNFDQARSTIERISDVEPTYDMSWIQAQIALREGRPADALTIIGQDAQLWRRLYIRALAHWALGDQDEARQALDRLIEEDAQDAAIQIAEIYDAHGDIENAFEWIDRAIDQRDPGIAQLRILFPDGTVHHDPRYKAVLERVGLDF